MTREQRVRPGAGDRPMVRRWEGEMLTVGVDAHKHVNMAVAIDAAGREVARWRQLAAWAAALGEGPRWGIEGCPSRLLYPRRISSSLSARVPESDPGWSKRPGQVDADPGT